VIRFSSNIREGDSGAPLLLGDYVVGILARGPGSATGSPIAVQVASIQDFLGELLPPRPSFPGYKAVKKDEIILDKAAEHCATQFLDFLIRNQLVDAYGFVADAVKTEVSEARFVEIYSQFAEETKSGLIKRQLAASKRRSSLPNSPQIAADVYVIDFESRYKDLPGFIFFESATVMKENGAWKVEAFVWNPQSSSPNGR
jgi:hypothetical protein